MKLTFTKVRCAAEEATCHLLQELGAIKCNASTIIPFVRPFSAVESHKPSVTFVGTGSASDRGITGRDCHSSLSASEWRRSQGLQGSAVSIVLESWF